jgi:hypothetical protein
MTVLLWLLLTLDGGVALRDAGSAPVSDDDRELIDNLELLQNLDGAADLELLQDVTLER